MDAQTRIYEVAIGVLLLGPVLAGLLAWRLGKTRRDMLPALTLTAALYVALWAIAYIAHVSFTTPGPNLVTGCLAYLAVAFVVVALGFLPISRWLSIPLQALAALPILAGYVLGSVGLLVLALMIDHVLTAPTETRRGPDGLICQVRILHGIPDDDAVSVELLRTWSPLPLQRRVSRHLERWRPDAAPTCADALAPRGS